MEKESKINLALVGCGQWGPNLVRNFSQLSEANLIKVCDLDKNKLDKLKEQYNLETTQKYGDLLNDKNIDAILIATPVATHFELARQALEAGKHVFIEKPETQTSPQAEELLKLSKQKNKVLMVDHVFKYSPAINKIKEIIDSGELGNIHYLRAEWLSLGRLQPEVNVIWDLAVHVFSTLIYILGMKPTSLSVNAQGYFRKNIEEIASVTLNFPGNIKVFVTISWTEPEKTRKITIIGNKKMLVYNMMDSDQLKIYNKTVNTSENEISYLDGEVNTIKVEETEPLKNSCAHFIDCIKNKKKPLSCGQDGLDVVRILEATSESIKNNGKEVFLKT